MKIKTSELHGAALDWAVAKCEGRENDGTWDENFSTNWLLSGPIIEREYIQLNIDLAWKAHIICEDKKFGGVERFENSGPTPLIAAMRCYIASKLGEECDIPDELITGE